MNPSPSRPSGSLDQGPRRIQRKRAKGWRMPEGAVYVGRPTVYGNPWGIEDARAWGVPVERRWEWVVGKYAEDAKRGVFDYIQSERFVTLAEMRSELAGKDLACWCPPDRPCHADVLLGLGNARGGSDA
jgi:hypothetical protein